MLLICHRSSTTTTSGVTPTCLQEIDFLVASNGRTHPVEVKLGSPRHERMQALEPIAEPGWERGQVVSLAAGAQPVRLTADWTVCAPGALDLGPDPS